MQQNRYVEQPTSRALPVLTSQVLTESLTCLRPEGEFQTLLAFEEWLQAQPRVHS